MGGWEIVCLSPNERMNSWLRVWVGFLSGEIRPRILACTSITFNSREILSAAVLDP